MITGEDVNMFGRRSKIILALFFLSIMFLGTISSCFANELGSGFDYDNVPVGQQDSTAVDTISKPIVRVWRTIVFVLRILSVAGVILVGLRYMFASADSKAEIKKSTIFMIVGIIIVFSFSTFIQYIIDVIYQIIE